MPNAMPNNQYHTMDIIAECVNSVLSTNSALVDSPGTYIELSRVVTEKRAREKKRNVVLDASMSRSVIKRLDALTTQRKILRKLKEETYDLNGLNGIFRCSMNTNTNDQYYEERVFTITTDDIWIVTIRTPCPADLIPHIIDYDYDAQVIDAVYGGEYEHNMTVSVRASKYAHKDEIQNSCRIVRRLNTDDADDLDSLIDAVTEIDETYSELFPESTSHEL